LIKLFVRNGEWIKFIARHLSRAQMRQDETDNHFGLFIQQFILKERIAATSFPENEFREKNENNNRLHFLSKKIPFL